MSRIDLEDVYRQGYCGYGITVGHPWGDHALVEAEYTHFVDDHDKPRHSLFVTGLRVGIRRTKFGVFAKLQPGVFRGADHLWSDPPSLVRFALSAGGVLEAFLEERVYTRLDLNVLIIWFGDATFRGVQNGRPGTSGHHFTSVGVGFRF